MNTRVILLASFALALGCQTQDRTMDRSQRAGEPTMGQDQTVIIDRTNGQDAQAQHSEVTFRQARGDQVAWYHERGIEQGTQAPSGEPGAATTGSQQDPRIQQLANRANDLVDEWEEPTFMRERRSGDRPGTFGSQPEGSSPQATPPAADEDGSPTERATAAHGEAHRTQGQLEVTLAQAETGQPSQPAAPGQTQAVDDQVELDLSFQDEQGREVRLQAKRAVQPPLDNASEQGAFTAWGEGQGAEYGAWFVADLVLDGQVVDSDRLIYLSAQPVQGGVAQAPADPQEARDPMRSTPRPQLPGEERAAMTGAGEHYAVHVVALPVSMTQNQAPVVEPLRILHDLSSDSSARRTTQDTPGATPGDPRPPQGTDQPAGADQPASQPTSPTMPGSTPDQASQSQDSLDILHVVFGEAERTTSDSGQPTG